MEERDIYLGALNSKVYINREQPHYKIWPILGTQSNFMMDSPIREIKVLKSTADEIFIKSSIWLAVKMKFQENTPGLLKARIIPHYFGFIPMGVYFGDISISDRDYLLKVFSK